MLVNMYGLQQDWKKATPLAAELVSSVSDRMSRFSTHKGEYRSAQVTWMARSRLTDARMSSHRTPVRSCLVISLLLKQAKNFSEAEIVLQDALDSDPQNSALKGELIRVEAEIGGLEAGLAKAREFAENDPGNSVYDVVSAELYEKAGRGKEAVALARQGRRGATLGR